MTAYMEEKFIYTRTLTHTHMHVHRKSLEGFTGKGRKLSSWEIVVGERLIFHHILMCTF